MQKKSGSVHKKLSSSPHRAREKSRGGEVDRDRRAGNDDQAVLATYNISNDRGKKEQHPQSDCCCNTLGLQCSCQQSRCRVGNNPCPTSRSARNSHYHRRYPQCRRHPRKASERPQVPQVDRQCPECTPYFSATDATR